MKSAVLKLGAGLLAVVLVLGIWREREPDPLSGRAEHVSGFTVSVPDDFEVRRPAGRLIMIEAGNIRAPRRLEITIHESRFAEPYAAGCRPDMFRAAGLKVCRISNVGSGSGGVLWQLDALLDRGSRIVQVQAQVQTEGRPSFEFARKVVLSLR